jgi:uncharacterized small protein (DUF1192 family)
MDPEELEPRRIKPETPNLDPMSVEELEAYIGGLEAEISRARVAISAKRTVRAGAESLFRR